MRKGSNGFQTCDARRAGAHPYRATRDLGRQSKRRLQPLPPKACHEGKGVEPSLTMWANRAALRLFAK
jgi:hypothetical protein